MEPNQDGSEVQETPEEVAGETTETLTPEEIADLKKKAGVSSQNFERAKKAEADLKEARKQLEGTVQSKDTLSTMDVLALAKAGIEDDDMDLVTKFAKLQEMTVKDALKDTTLKAILDTKAEERRTAATAHTKGGARGTSKVTGEDLLRKAETTGEVPTSTEGMQALFIARRAQRAK